MTIIGSNFGAFDEFANARYVRVRSNLERRRHQIFIVVSRNRNRKGEAILSGNG